MKINFSLLIKTLFFTLAFFKEFFALDQSKCASKDNTYASDFLFDDIGHFNNKDQFGVTFNKHYFLSKFIRGFWFQMKDICDSYGMDFVSLESELEASELLFKLRERLVYGHDDVEKFIHIFINAATPDPGSTYMCNINSGANMTFYLEWQLTPTRWKPDMGKFIEPTGKDFGKWGKEQCLAISRISEKYKEIGYNDLLCSGSTTGRVLCEKYKVFDGENWTDSRRTENF